jgi:hypothetical protein
MNMTGNKIYCDLDGVLVGFDERYRELFGEDPDGECRRTLFCNIRSKSRNFWMDMPWEKGGRELWAFIAPHSPTILSSPTSDRFCRPGKRKWVRDNLGEEVPVILESAKHLYAGPGAVLIDDTPAKIENWRNAGGIGILHESLENTLEELGRVLAKNVCSCFPDLVPRSGPAFTDLTAVLRRLC